MLHIGKSRHIDSDVNVVIDYYKHLFSDFFLPHFTTHKLLCQVEFPQLETIIHKTQVVSKWQKGDFI